VDEDGIRALLKAARAGTLGERVDRASAALLGRPYAVQPLGGGPGQPEVLSASLDGFDCVTYLETVLAAARARTVEAFLATLRRLRYRRGRVGWSTRHHYMTDWARENAARGAVRDLTRGRGTVVRRRRLSVPGIAGKATRFRCFPKRRLPRGAAATGDLVLFASTRPDLDVFHVGLLVRRDGELRLRHAPRSRGRVVDQPLAAFLAAERMSGVILLRPREGRPSSRRTAPR